MTVELLTEERDGLRVEIAELREELAPLRRCTPAVLPLRAGTAAETAASEFDQLTHFSQRDALTGTPNRALMLDRLEAAIALARRRSSLLAVLFLDLDGFKQINDSLGHAVGDDVLRFVARRLGSVLRDSDTVSRHSGDEFVVLLLDVAHASDAELTAKKLLEAVAEPSSFGEQTLHLSASVGIAVFPCDGDDAVSLINLADAAMYQAKRRGRGGLASHSPSEDLCE